MCFRSKVKKRPRVVHCNSCFNKVYVIIEKEILQNMKWNTCHISTKHHKRKHPHRYISNSKYLKHNRDVNSYSSNPQVTRSRSSSCKRSRKYLSNVYGNNLNNSYRSRSENNVVHYRLGKCIRSQNQNPLLHNLLKDAIKLELERQLDKKKTKIKETKRDDIINNVYGHVLDKTFKLPNVSKQNCYDNSIIRKQCYRKPPNFTSLNTNSHHLQRSNSNINVKKNSSPVSFKSSHLQKNNDHSQINQFTDEIVDLLEPIDTEIENKSENLVDINTKLDSKHPKSKHRTPIKIGQNDISNKSNHKSKPYRIKEKYNSKLPKTTEPYIYPQGFAKCSSHQNEDDNFPPGTCNNCIEEECHKFQDPRGMPHDLDMYGSTENLGLDVGNSEEPWFSFMQFMNSNFEQGGENKEGAAYDKLLSADFGDFNNGAFAM